MVYNKWDHAERFLLLFFFFFVSNGFLAAYYTKYINGLNETAKMRRLISKFVIRVYSKYTFSYSAKMSRNVSRGTLSCLSHVHTAKTHRSECVCTNAGQKRLLLCTPLIFVFA